MSVTTVRVVALVSGVVLTLAAAVVTPRQSIEFWGRLARGETGLGHSIIYFTNQSAMADAIRIFGLGPGGTGLGLVLSALIAALGVWAAVLWDRRGDIPLAVMLGGIATLLASPVSWLHHFVWVVPLAVVLVRDLLPVGAPRRLPVWFGVLGLIFCGWVAVEPFRNRPGGGDLELTWTAAQKALGSVTLVLGVAVLVAAVVVALRRSPTPVAGTAATAPRGGVEDGQTEVGSVQPVQEVHP